MAKKRTTAPFPASASPSPVMKSFTGSLLLLVVALAVFFGVMTYPRKRTDIPVVKDDAAAQVAATRRQMRQAPVRREAPVEAPREDAPAPRSAPATPRAQATAAPGATPPASQPTDPEVQRAISLIDSGQVQEAAAVLEGILKKDPRNESALVELAMINLLDLKQPDQAMGYLQRVMDVNPQNQVVLSELVSLYEEQGRLEEGLQFLQDINAKNPDAPELSYGIGQMLALQGRDNEAIPYLEKATSSPDNSVRAFRDLAEAYSRSGDSERALTAYDKAIQSQEKDIAEKNAHGMPVSFAEERLNYTKMDKARELIRVGDVDNAQALIDEISRSMPGDESLTALQEQLNRRRAG